MQIYIHFHLKYLFSRYKRWWYGGFWLGCRQKLVQGDRDRWRTTHQTAKDGNWRWDQTLSL